MNGSPGARSRGRRLEQRVAVLPRHARRGALEQPGADQQVVGQLGLALPASSLAVTCLRQVAIGSPQPSTRKVHSPTLSGLNWPWNTSGVRPGDIGSSWGLTRCRRADHVLDRHGFRLLTRPADLGQLRVRRAVIAHHQRGGNGVVAFPPHRGPDRHDLADDGLGREPSAGHDGRDVIDLDTTGTTPSLLHWRGREGCTADVAAVLVVWFRNQSL